MAKYGRELKEEALCPAKTIKTDLHIKDPIPKLQQNLVL